MPIRETSTRCWRKIILRLAPSARCRLTTPTFPENFASSRPTVLRRHTARNMKEMPSSTLLSFSTTSFNCSHSLTVLSRVFSGRWNRPSFFCSPT
mgnify:CR=1 FL=1